MASRAGRGPGGIPKFLAQKPLQPTILTTPASLGTAEGENVARFERVVYDQTSTPVFIPAAVAAAQTLVAATTDLVRRTAIRSLAVFAATSALAEPVFVPPTVTTPITSTMAAAHGSTTVVFSRVIYDQTSTPVFRPPAATPSAFAYQPADVAWLRQRKDLPDGYVESFRPPAAATPVAPLADVARIRRRITLPDGVAAPVTVSTVAVTPSSAAPLANSCTVVRTGIVVRDQTSAPCFPPTPPPPPVDTGRFVSDAPQADVVHRRVKPIPLSAYVFAYPIDDLATNDDNENLLARVSRARRKVLPDGVAQPLTVPPPPPAPPALGSIASAYSAPTVILSRVVYDQQAARPAFPPAAPVTTATPSVLDQAQGPAPQRRISRPGIKLILEGIERPWPPVPAVTPSFLFETYTGAKAAPINRDAVKADLDGFQPRLIALPAFTPSYLFETIPPPWTAKPNRVAIKSNLDGIERPSADVAPPPPVASTPADLFDNIGAVTRTLPNARAIGINLQGFAWSPQDPANLTGSVTVPDTGPGGACRLGTKGPWLPYYREAREKDFKKSRKRKKYEELLEELQAKADVPAVVVEAVSVLAGKTEAPRPQQGEIRADLGSLVALVHAYQVNQPVIAPVEERVDDEGEMIALIQALEEDEFGQIMGIALTLLDDED